MLSYIHCLFQIHSAKSRGEVQEQELKLFQESATTIDLVVHRRQSQRTRNQIDSSKIESKIGIIRVLLLLLLSSLLCVFVIFLNFLMYIILLRK